MKEYIIAFWDDHQNISVIILMNELYYLFSHYYFLVGVRCSSMIPNLYGINSFPFVFKSCIFDIYFSLFFSLLINVTFDFLNHLQGTVKSFFLKLNTEKTPVRTLRFQCT